MTLPRRRRHGAPITISGHFSRPLYAAPESAEVPFSIACLRRAQPIGSASSAVAAREELSRVGHDLAGERAGSGVHLVEPRTIALLASDGSPCPAARFASGTRVQVYRCGMDELMTTDACTMPTTDRPLRLAEFDALFAEAVRSVAYEGNLVRLHLSGPAGLRDRVRDLAERETACCSFFSFVIDGEPDDLMLEISAPPEQRNILKGLARRAVEMSA